MKLKVLGYSAIAFILLIAGYQKYTEYQDLRSIKNYDECVVAKGSIIQESYPATCITKIDTSFIQQVSTSPDITIRPIPAISEWKKYTDFSTSYSQFSFEYPDFMPEPAIYWRNERVKRFISSYSWQVDSLNVGNYTHDIDLRITGPYPDTEGSLLIEWIKEQGWPYQEGKTQEMAGYSQVIYKNVGSQKVVHTTFTETGVDYPRSWTLFFKSQTGIYRIDLAIQGTPQELASYQDIFPHIVSTLRFTDNQQSL